MDLAKGEIYIFDMPLFVLPHDSLYVPDVCESFFFAFFRQHPEPFFQNVCGVGMHFFSGSAAHIVFQGAGIGVVFALVVFAGSHPVTEHFFQIHKGHFHRFILLGGRVYIIPVFKMMPVPAFMVEPCGGIAEQFPFPFVGTSGALIIPHPGEKLRRAEFGKVVDNTPEGNAALHGVFHHQFFVMGYGFQMADGMEHDGYTSQFDLILL